jgi:hypothetical protein
MTSNGDLDLLMRNAPLLDGALSRFQARTPAFLQEGAPSWIIYVEFYALSGAGNRLFRHNNSLKYNDQHGE